MSPDNQIKPADQQKPPDPEEFAKNHLWEFLRRIFGPRAGVLFLIIMSAVYFHSEIGQVMSDLYAQIVEWWPLPKAKPDVFTIAVARLEDDDEKAHMETIIARDLHDLGKSNGIAVLEFSRVISDQDLQAGHVKARKWLKESGAQVLLWGRVLVVPGKPAVPQLYWTNSEGSNERNESGRYGLDENLRLPTAFQSDLSDILHLLVVTQSSAFNAEEGHFVADRLRPFIARVRHLLAGDAAKTWTAEDLARTKRILGDALSTVGQQSGDSGEINEAIGLYHEALTGFPRRQYPLDWAMIQNNLGVALMTVGTRESLTEAVAAYGAALEEFTEERVPLNWAMTESNLGNALSTLGDRESGTQHLTEAIAAYRAALEERTKVRDPIDWATTQNNIGTTLRFLGIRTHDANALCQAVGDHISAWQVSSEAPHYASMFLTQAKIDVAAIHDQSPGTTPSCLQTYSADLKRMGVPN